MKHFYSKTIQIPIYYGNLIVVAANNFDEVKKSFPDLSNVFSDGEDIYAHAVKGFYTPPKSKRSEYAYYIVMDLDNDDFNCSLVHECYHVLNYVMERKGMVHDFSNHEPGAYLIEWLFKESSEAYGSFRKLKDKKIKKGKK